MDKDSIVIRLIQFRIAGSDNGCKGRNAMLVDVFVEQERERE